MAIRSKRSVSLPPELDAEIQQEAIQDGMTYSAWLASAARKELAIRAGLAAIAEVEAEIGALTGDERAEAAEWAEHAVKRGRRNAGGKQQAA